MPTAADDVVLPQPRRQHILQHDIARVVTAQRQRLVGRQILPAHGHQELQGRNLGG